MTVADGGSDDQRFKFAMPPELPGDRETTAKRKQRCYELTAQVCSSRLSTTRGAG
jgi:hypothetical protein